MVTEAAHHRASLDPAIVGGAIHAAMYIAKGHVAEAVGMSAAPPMLEISTFPLLSRIERSPRIFPCLDTSKRSCDVCRGGLRQSNRAIAPVMVTAP